MQASVVGGGAWGTVLADLLARGEHHVRLWALEPDVVERINRCHDNPRFLPGVQLHPQMRACADIRDAVRDAELVLFVSPSHVLREVVRSAAPHVDRTATFVVATKGIERKTLALMTDVVAGEVAVQAVVALSGPSFALEVANQQPTAVVAASTDAAAAERVQSVLSSPTFRIYTNDDVVGVELAGALKNVMAVATGIAEGLDLGLNSRAALITRGLAEMTRLGVALGARATTFAGLAGMGDLVLTCTGALSRNRAVGLELGRGRTLEQALAARDSVAEGVLNAESAYELARRHDVEMPIVRGVYRILFEGHRAHAAIAELMGRELRSEHDR
jgi:glycerol-3-phosphate dehydrogenase (NAD(P)+)